MNIEDGVIQLNFQGDILDHLTAEQKIELGKELCLADEVLDHFLTQVMDTAASQYLDAHLHRARLRFVELMPAAAVQVIRSLLGEVHRSRVEADHYRQRAMELEEWMPTRVSCPNPSCDQVLSFRKPEPKPYPSTPCPMAQDLIEKCGFEWLEPKDISTQEEIL